MLVGEAPLDLRTVDDCDVQNYDGYKQIPDPKSVSDGGFSDLDEMLNYMLDNSDNQIDGGVRKMDDCHVQIDEGHKQIPDPKSPELEKTTDTEPEWTDESDMDSSDTGEILDDDQTDGDKQMLTDEGESRKRKRNASCCTCRPRRPAKTRKLALPEGFGYVPSASYVDEDGVYQPVFTHQVAYMRCRRCGINGDHWEPFCLNPINDPPETEEEAAKKKISWKYLLRNFNPKEYLEKHKTQEPEFDPPRLPELKFIGPKSRRAVFRLVFG